MLTMLSLLLLSLFTLDGVLPLSQNKVTTSADLSHPSGQPLSIFCDYDSEDEEFDQLVVTWYFRGSPIPIYQWVPGLNMPPQIIHEMFKDNLDLSEDEDADKVKKHSALHIINPDAKFAGSYKCRVSSFTKEVTDEKEVKIYVPPTSLSVKNFEGSVECEAEAVYPLPSLILTWTLNSTVYSEDTIDVTKNENNPDLFDVRVRTTIDEADITGNDMMTCEVFIPESDYSNRVEELLSPKNHDEDGETVNLQEKPCASGDCEASEEAAPQDYEYIEKTIDTGAALNTFSGDAAGFVESTSSHLEFLYFTIVMGLLAGILL